MQPALLASRGAHVRYLKRKRRRLQLALRSLNIQYFIVTDLIGAFPHVYECRLLTGYPNSACLHDHGARAQTAALLRKRPAPPRCCARGRLLDDVNLVALLAQVAWYPIMRRNSHAAVSYYVMQPLYNGDYRHPVRSAMQSGVHFTREDRLLASPYGASVHPHIECIVHSHFLGMCSNHRSYQWATTYSIN